MTHFFFLCSLNTLRACFFGELEAKIIRLFMFHISGSFVMFPFFVPCMIAVTKSLRISVLVGSFLMMVSAAMKCIIGNN